jgi:spore germination protein KA
VDLNINFDYADQKLLPQLDASLKELQKLTSGSSDLLTNSVNISGVNCALITTEGMLSIQAITNLVLVPLSQVDYHEVTGEELLKNLQRHKLLSTEVKTVSDYGTLLRMSNSGFAILLAEGCDFALGFGVQAYNVRSISEPSSEQNIMGSHEGFVEVVRTNMSLIRRRLKSPVLTFELFTRGTKSYTDICLCYMVDRVPNELVERVKKSLQSEQLETILTTGYIKPFLESPKARIFESVGYTERPDVLCSRLLEGRIGILIDGTPFALVVPKLFSDTFQTLDDYSGKPYFATYIRWLKYVSFIIAVLLPSMYVAISVHNPELLNRVLLLLLAESEKNAPFSILTESFGVLLVYEVIKEAGLRLPKNIGGAVSIVAGLIIGDCAVSSGLISNPILTVSAVAVVCGFTVPDVSQQVSILRLAFLLVGGVFGLYGIGLLTMAVLFNLCDTQDYGFPLTYPLTPFDSRCMRDVLTRVSFRKMQSGNFTINHAKK